ncbi:DEAD/DEAH box helicase [Solimonas terrae]|uniref:ATP-dependent RNA helicase RhlB n=1 Tax=Solimonas terrae TaxID=1396819 RepID=A0A6M2BWW2_9GAMM|nr:DEAD/DEAH box helicase [Solimonas terrae]NGY06681.1 DEAD/DEAH box helicase [Solimonas terrae]
MQPDHLSAVRFADLPLHASLQAGLSQLGYSHCTPIQAQALPRALNGEDLAGQAQTGTGKSAAFLLATMNRLLTHPRAEGDDPNQPRAFILAPTRELAVQIYNDAMGLGAQSGLRMTVCYGGAGYELQRQSIEGGVDILIGTPGRLIDYFKQGTYHLRQIEVLVLDEADRMFDLGFIADIRYLIRKMPPPAQRKNYLFSATLSQRVLELAYEHMNSPQKIEIEPDQVTAERVRQELVHVSNDEKLPFLIGLLRHRNAFRSLVFINTKRGAEFVEKGLRLNGFEASVLSGDVSQGQRLRLLEDFKQGKLPVLVATDVAARGLHIPGVDLVVNYDLPQDAEDYVHRIGRTARAGATGDAVSLCCETWVYSLPEIEKYIGNRLPVMPDGHALIASDFVAPKPEPRRHHAGGGANRGRRPPPRRR